MNHENWIKRTQRRSDITTRLTHLTRSQNGMSAFDVLNKILEEKCIHGSTRESGYIVGDDRAVCFQDVPLLGVAENIIYENQLQKRGDRKRYEAFGIRVNKQHAYKRGARPVIYGQTYELKNILSPSEYWRIVNYDITDIDNAIDWTHEREWRIKGDYYFIYNQIDVIVANSQDYKKFIEYWMKKDPNLLLQINGINVLDSFIK